MGFRAEFLNLAQSALGHVANASERQRPAYQNNQSSAHAQPFTGGQRPVYRQTSGLAGFGNMMKDFARNASNHVERGDERYYNAGNHMLQRPAPVDYTPVSYSYQSAQAGRIVDKPSQFASVVDWRNAA